MYSIKNHASLIYEENLRSTNLQKLESWKQNPLNKANVRLMSFLEAIQVSFYLFIYFWVGVTAHLDVAEIFV
jgi:hypothetical protein